jgi:DNA/RNA-binding protein KIN17
MIAFAQDPTKFMEKHSSEFHAEFMSVFSTRYRDKKVDANRVYQEVISNREHTHLNSTRWMTLTGYVKYLGQSGLAKVEETERGFDIQYIDKSQLAELEAQRKRAQIEKTEEERERKALQNQVEKARAADEAASSSKPDQQQQVYFSFSAFILLS